MISIPSNNGESEQDHEKRVRAELDSKLANNKGLGDGDLHAGRYNMALLRRAIRSDWPIPEEARSIVAEQMTKIVKSSRKIRDKVAAAKVLVDADKVNVSRESLDQRAGITELQLAVRGEESKRTENHLHLHGEDAGQTVISIIQREDFYGNDAHDRDSETS